MSYLEHYIKTLRGNKVIFDPSMFYKLMKHECKNSNIEIFVPDKLLKVIKLSEKNDKYKALLEKIMRYFSYINNKLIFTNEDWKLFYKNINTLQLVGISDEECNKDSLYSELNEKLSFDKKFEIELSPKFNILKDSVTKIIVFSKSRKIPILSSTRRLSTILRGIIVIIELPFRFYLNMKFSFISKIFGKIDNTLRLYIASLLDYCYDIPTELTDAVFIFGDP